MRPCTTGQLLNFGSRTKTWLVPNCCKRPGTTETNLHSVQVVIANWPAPSKRAPLALRGYIKATFTPSPPVGGPSAIGPPGPYSNESWPEFPFFSPSSPEDAPALSSACPLIKKSFGCNKASFSEQSRALLAGIVKSPSAFFMLLL